MPRLSLTLDQLQVFVDAAAAGSFSHTARRMHRAQSAVTYAVQKLEQQLGTQLFDRSGHRLRLTGAGAALLPRATRIVREAVVLGDQARGITQGLEPELSMVVDAMFPMPRLIEALRRFGEQYPTVPTRIHVAAMGATVDLVTSGACAIGIVVSFTSTNAALRRAPVEQIAMVAVAAPGHPLAAFAGPIPTDELQHHVQLVLTDPSGRTGSHDQGVLSSRNWRLADLGAKHAMLLGGLGWGGMPAHMVQADLDAGRLRRILPEAWGSPDRAPTLQMDLVHREDSAPGPAAQWLSDWLTGQYAQADQRPAPACRAS